MSSTSSNPSRPYDIIVWGATGFTGRYVAEYLARNAPMTLKWAIGGRNEKKLEAIKEVILQCNGHWSAVAIFVADSQDVTGLSRIVSQTKVVISTVGPFMQYGFPLVKACVECKTDYVDITGEPIFVRRLIDEHHERAKREGTLIIPCCGFDSAPSDIVVYLAAKALREKGYTTGRVKGTLHKIKGTAGGGTLATALHMLSLPTKMVREAMNPYYLVPAGYARGVNQRFTPPCYYDRDFDAPQGVFPLCAGDELNVRRSAAIATPPYGANFAYRETMRFRWRIAAWVTTMILAGGGLLIMYVPPFRWLLKKFIPKAGEGPTRESVEAGCVDVRCIAEADMGEGNISGEVVTMKARFFSKGCPGYGTTRLLVVEAALCLALDRAKCAGKGGVMTSASGMGDAYVERLKRAGVELSVGGNVW